MFSNDEAEELIRLPKTIVGDGSVNLSYAQTRISLISSDAPKYSFIAEITLNKKIEFKLSLHHQEHNSCIGLLRIDYRGRHTNPGAVHADLPEKFKLYAGKEFGIDEPHIHCYVSGYKQLAWALPLPAYGFATPDINSTGDIIQAINAFTKEIHITSTLAIQTSLI